MDVFTASFRLPRPAELAFSLRAKDQPLPSPPLPVFWLIEGERKLISVPPWEGT